MESSFIQKQRQKRILEAIGALKPKLKEVIVMYEMQEMSYEDIAEKIKCPVGTVRSRLFNARKELSITLKDLM
ncbi:sigma-70 family RNA polymerase sigma factor [bacterium]|nr:sigma-70 family RNA polymerase sigma factor [bacterium]